jgi:hypothetical protein
MAAVEAEANGVTDLDSESQRVFDLAHDGNGVREGVETLEGPPTPSKAPTPTPDLTSLSSLLPNEEETVRVGLEQRGPEKYIFYYGQKNICVDLHVSGNSKTFSPL